MADQEASPETLTFAFDGDEYKFDDFTLGECEYLEEEMGVPVEEIPWTSMKAAVRIVYLIKRRVDSDFTLEDARALKISVFDDPEAAQAANGNGGSARPTSQRGGKKKAAHGRQTSRSSSASKSGTSSA